MKIHHPIHIFDKTEGVWQVRNLMTSVLCGIVLTLSVPVFSQSAEIEFSRDSQNLVLSFTETHGVMAGVDSVTTLHVYGNGLVKVHFPPFMKKAGDYQMMKDDESLNELLQSLAEKSIPELDVKEAQSEKNDKIIQARHSNVPDLFAVYDASTTTIKLNLDRYTKRPSNRITSNNDNGETLLGSGYEVFNLEKKITWKGLRTDSKRFPNIEAIQNLAAAQQLLLSVTESDQLIRSE